MLLCAGVPPTVASAGQVPACTAVGPTFASCAPTADVPLKTAMGRGRDHLGGVLPCPGQHAELPPACHQQLCTENRKPARPSVQDQCPLPSPEHLRTCSLLTSSQSAQTSFCSPPAKWGLWQWVPGVRDKEGITSLLQLSWQRPRYP